MIQREISRYLKKVEKNYPIITLTGPRQSGKTTLTKEIFSHKPYVSLEDIDQREFALQDPRGFLKTFDQGAVIDEAQYCPNLFSYLQTKVDSIREPGQFILTGSQNFLLLEKVSQSLAGRAAIAYLLPLSYEELKKIPNVSEDPFEFVQKGFYPRIYDLGLEPGEWYRNYINTYIERDVRQIQNITDLSKFQMFIRLCAGRIGQLLNLSSIASDCSVTYNTIKSWISILEASFIVFLLRPHHKNFNKRLVKQPKLYFYDTGLACALLGINNTFQLKTHYLKGPLFENFIIAELIKDRFNQGINKSFYFWRDNHGHELDLIIEESQNLIPLEIKSGETIISEFFKGIKYWNELSGGQKGYVIYPGSQLQKRETITVLPWKKMSQILY